MILVHTRGALRILTSRTLQSFFFTACLLTLNGPPLPTICKIIIMITRPCNLHLFSHHYYILELGCSGVYLFSLIFALKHRLWLLFRNRLTEAVLTCTHDLCFEQKLAKIIFFYLKISIFTAFHHHCILYKHVSVLKNRASS